MTGSKVVRELRDLDHVKMTSGQDATFRCEYRKTGVQNVTFVWTSRMYKSNTDGFHLTSVRSMFFSSNETSSGLVFRSTYAQSYSNRNELLVCIMESIADIRVMLDYQIKPRIVVSSPSNNHVKCTVLSLTKPDYIMMHFESGTVIENRTELISIEPNIYQLDTHAVFWGIYICAVKSVYGFAKTSLCLTPEGSKSLIGGDNKCELELEMGRSCWTERQCKSRFCFQKVCTPESPKPWPCHAHSDCQMWANKSICGPDNICRCREKDLLISQEYKPKCVKLVALFNRCDSSSKCLIDNSQCISHTCSCVSGYVAKDDKW